jgi:hypothetical protein
MSSAPEPLQSRMLAAGEAWLVWAATHGINPLVTTVDELERAALDLHADGGTEMDVLDLLDQVGFMTGLWRRAEWLDLRRTILTSPNGPGKTGLSSFANVQGTMLLTHGPEACVDDDACPIHRASRHALHAAPMAWRVDIELLERICPHGIHHPDPDDLTRQEQVHGTTHQTQLERHDCDGCCRAET